MGSHPDEIDRSDFDKLFHSLPQGVIDEVVAGPNAGVNVGALPAHLVEHRSETVWAVCGPREEVEGVGLSRTFWTQGEWEIAWRGNGRAFC